MQNILIGGCSFCGNQDCTEGQCRSVEIEEVFPFVGDAQPEESTTSEDETDWKELEEWMVYDNQNWNALKEIVSKMLEKNKI